MPAVRGVSCRWRPGRASGSQASPAAASPRSRRPCCGCSRRTPASRGSILVNGRNVQTMRWGHLRALRWAEAAMVFQGALHSLNPVQRIGDQIAEPIRLHDHSVSKAQAASRVGELLEQVGLPASRARSYPHQLSGGQKQRIMIAMALACRPQLIIADEPTTALDVMVQAQVLGVLTDLVHRPRPRPAADQPRPLGARDDLRPGRWSCMPAGSSKRVRPRTSSSDRCTRTAVRSPRPSPGSATRGPGSRRSDCRATRPTHGRCRPAARSTPAARWPPTCARRPTRRSRHTRAVARWPACTPTTTAT